MSQFDFIDLPPEEFNNFIDKLATPSEAKPHPIEILRPGKVMSDYCKCGHLKDHHLSIIDRKAPFGPERVLQCQDMVYSPEANKMLQCGCKI